MRLNDFLLSLKEYISWEFQLMNFPIDLISFIHYTANSKNHHFQQF